MPDLNTAIAEAEKELLSKIEDKGEKAPPSSTESPEVTLDAEETQDDVDDETSETEPPLSDAEIDEANRLYKALRNPKTSGPIVAALAAQAGLHLTSASPKSEVKEVKRSIQDKVADALGDQYKFLAPQLGKAIESALESVQEENNTKLAEIRQSQIERDVTTAYEQLARTTKGESKKLETRMAALAEEIPIGSQSVSTYIRRLYDVAVAENQKTSAKQTVERIRRNAGNAPERLKGSPAGTEPKLPDKKMGLKDSVNWALEELKKQK